MNMKKLVIIYIALAISLILNVFCIIKINSLNKDIKNISNSYYELDAKIEKNNYKLKRQIEEVKDDLEEVQDIISR